MIFVCTGSRNYQFNRLIKKVDELVRDGFISDRIVMQTGESDYIPEYCEYYRYVDRDQYKKLQEEADLIISHGGTGALIGALKLGKRVIAVPRLARYGEHIDNHQLQITGILEKEGYLTAVENMDELGAAIEELKKRPGSKKYDKPSNVMAIIERFIEEKL